MKLIVAGGRDFNNFPLMREKLDHLLCKHDGPITIISGTANGADKWGEAYARLHGYPVEQYPAQWKKYGRSAGYKRNAQMADLATHCVVFWDGKSRGSMHMINLAKEKGLEVRVVSY